MITVSVVNPFEPDPPTEAERVEDWREHELLRAGWPVADAIELARRSDVDLHRACELLAHGCDPVTAAEILR